MRALIVIFLILALIALISVIPIRMGVYVQYGCDGLKKEWNLRFGFITLKPKKIAKHTSAKPHKHKVKKETEKAEKKSPSVTNVIKFIRDNKSYVKKLIISVTDYIVSRGVAIEKFRLKSDIGTGDAMNTALVYGSASAVLYNTLGLLDKCINIKNINVEFKPDFNESKIFIDFESIIKTRIYNVVALAVIAFIRLIPLIRKRGDLTNGKSD